MKILWLCSHEDIDVSHPEFFSAAKMNGYVPPNKEVITLSVFFFSVRVSFDLNHI